MHVQEQVHMVANSSYIIDGSGCYITKTMQEQEMMEILMVIITVIFILQTMFHMEMESMAWLFIKRIMLL